MIADDNADLLVVTENGYGKRTRMSEYPRKGRGGMGVQTVKLTEARGKLAGAMPVREGYQVMLISTGGQVIRMPTEGIRRAGRATQGVIVMRLREKGEQVSSLAPVVEARTAPTSMADADAEPRAAAERRASPRPSSEAEEESELAAQPRRRFFGRQRIHVDPGAELDAGGDRQPRHRCRCATTGPSWSQRFSGRARLDCAQTPHEPPRPVASAAASNGLAKRIASRVPPARSGSRRDRLRRAGQSDDEPALLEDELAVRHRVHRPLGDDGRWRLAKPHELRVRVREARAGGFALVDDRVDVGEPCCARRLRRGSATRPRRARARSSEARRSSAGARACARPPPAARMRDRGSARRAPASRRSAGSRSVSGGVRSSRPAQNGQSSSSPGSGGGSSCGNAPGRLARLGRDHHEAAGQGIAAQLGRRAAQLVLSFCLGVGAFEERRDQVDGRGEDDRRVVGRSRSRAASAGSGAGARSEPAP